jgi:hypothetical protein
LGCLTSRIPADDFPEGARRVFFRARERSHENAPEQAFNSGLQAHRYLLPGLDYHMK